jgi:hypothetical protein
MRDRACVFLSTTTWDLKDIVISKKDSLILRKLAERLAELSTNPIEEKKELWYKHNSLWKTKPVIFCDPELAWNEIIKERAIKSTKNCCLEIILKDTSTIYNNVENIIKRLKIAREEIESI